MSVRRHFPTAARSDTASSHSIHTRNDDAGNRTQVVEADGDRVTWTYDATYQLLSERRSGANAYRHTFTYDPAGNRLTKDDGTQVTTYSYDAANRLEYSQDGSGRTTYTFDAAGNERTIEAPSGDLTTYAWDYENQMRSAEAPAGELTTYTYSAELQRVAKETETETTKFVWDGQNIAQEYDELDVTQADYTHDPRPAPQPFGDLVSQRRDGESSFYQFDALGSSRALTDDAEVVTDESTYEAFGKPAATSGTTQNPFQWVGEKGYYADDETSLYSLRRRQYGSGEGRFLSEDPARSEANCYRPIKNNPISRTDPSGLDDEFVLIDYESGVGSDIPIGNYFRDLLPEIDDDDTSEQALLSLLAQQLLERASNPGVPNSIRLQTATTSDQFASESEFTLLLESLKDDDIDLGTLTSTVLYQPALSFDTLRSEYYGWWTLALRGEFGRVLERQAGFAVGLAIEQTPDLGTSQLLQKATGSPTPPLLLSALGGETLRQGLIPILPDEMQEAAERGRIAAFAVDIILLVTAVGPAVVGGAVRGLRVLRVLARAARGRSSRFIVRFVQPRTTPNVDPSDITSLRRAGEHPVPERAAVRTPGSGRETPLEELDDLARRAEELEVARRRTPHAELHRPDTAGQNPNRASLTLEYEAGWNRRDFSRKTRALQDLAERRRLRKASNPVDRDPHIAGQYKNRLIRQAHRQFAHSDPQRFARLRDRIRSMHPDHIHELQLSGLDDSSNLWLLDADVNVGIGRQIWQHIRSLPDGTIIDRIDVRGF